MNITTHVIADAFGIDASREAVAVGFDDCNSNPLVPVRDSAHVFCRDFLRRTINFLNDPDGDAFFISGPTGSGKTSGISQVASRLNWPLASVTATGRLEFQDLVGHHSLVAMLPGEEPSMTFVDGPLTSAMRNGHILLINEADVVDPAELSGLNDVLEGRPLIISENGGELVKPHPMFRVVVTGNSCGSGDETGAYMGVRQQNIAAMDRYRMVVVDYLDPEQEESLLTAKVPELNGHIAGKMVRLANEIRLLFTGDDERPGGEISFPMSTRVLVRWAKLTVAYEGSPSRLRYALDEALLARAAKEERMAINQLAMSIFGEEAWGSSN